jgi:site-specific DNA-methyltransferase (adenine-specific)
MHHNNIKKEKREKLPRLDSDLQLHEKIIPFCRLSPSEIWEDPRFGHRVGVLDAARAQDVARIMGNDKTTLVVNDPPYNVLLAKKSSKNLGKCALPEYLDFSRKWIANALAHMADDASFYLWIGADVNDGFQPLPDLMVLLREFPTLRPRNFITMRNQRGYGTQKNWMWVRQELLYYIKGAPVFNIDAEYTDIPKILRGYYKEVKGELTENLQRSCSDTIRAGNVWVDVQQVFYRMEENVPGCYAQKPLKSIERIIAASSRKGDVIVDFFAHSGTTLIAGEKLGRKVFTFDNDPVFAEIAIRRLERYRETGKTGWQWESPFPEIS